MIIKHSDLINTLIVCVGGFGFIAGLLRYVDDWREKRKEKPIEFSTFEVLWEAFSGGGVPLYIFIINHPYRYPHKYSCSCNHNYSYS